MALALRWQRALIAGAFLLALGACESVTTAEAPEPSAPVADRSPRVASEIARGRQALAAGDLQSARAAFTAALRGSPDDPEPAIGLAETYLALGDFETAGRLFGIVASSGAGAHEARLLQGRGLVALAQGQTEEAAGLLEQSVDRDTTQWRAWAGLGRAYARQGKTRQARTAFSRAEEVAPSPAIVINDTGMLHLEDNDPAAALEAFQRALAVDPGNATANANARIARAMLGDYDAAVSGARPDELPHVLNNVGYIAIVNGDFDVADRLLRRAIEMSPVYHEAASANLDLLAQAMKGIPVVALAGRGAPASTATAGAELSSAAAASDRASASFAPSSPEFGRLPTEALPSTGDSTASASEAPSIAGVAPAAPGPAAELTNVAAPPAADGVMAHGFRWDAQPVSVNAGKRRGKRKAAELGASPDGVDPRGAAWPAIAVPPPQAAVGTAEADRDRQAHVTREERVDAVTAPEGATAAASGSSPDTSESGWPE